MIDISKIYRDKDGAGRLYIPKKVLESLGWKDKLVYDGSTLMVEKL